MKKKIIILFVLPVIALVAGLNLKHNESGLLISTLTLSNIEALAQLEQPNTDDCIKDDNYNCEALHPTDPSKDQLRQGARW